MDSEVFKLILNGGSFALLAVLVLWAIFHAVPLILATAKAARADDNQTILALGAKIESSVATLVMQFRGELTEQRIWNAAEAVKRDMAYEKLANSVNRVVGITEGCQRRDLSPTDDLRVKRTAT